MERALEVLQSLEPNSNSDVYVITAISKHLSPGSNWPLLLEFRQIRCQGAEDRSEFQTLPTFGFLPVKAEFWSATTAALRAGASTVLRIPDKNAVSLMSGEARALREEHTHDHDCPAYHESSSAATGTSRVARSLFSAPCTPTVLRRPSTRAQLPPYCRTTALVPGGVSEDRCESLGPYDERYWDEYLHLRDWPARCGSSSASTGTMGR
ncbi:hypothetical protein B0H13DRAFT_2367561 [Mycena leptocephala]|nr:hypothetical protein B0H13DRAFT_2367561 [Mycena leptocephala]